MRRLILILAVLQFVWVPALRADTMDPVRKEIASAADEKSLAKALEAAQDSFLKDNKFDEYVRFLSSLSRKDPLRKSLIDFTIGQTRLMQLKHLEEGQEWEQYFNKGVALRKEAVERLEGAYKTSAPGSTVNLYSSLLLWQYHKDQQDPSQDESMSRLSGSIKAFAEGSKDADPLKKTADALSEYGEKGKAREAYALYFHKITEAGMTDEKLLEAAGGFLKEGNIDLAESAFGAYAEKAGAYAREKRVPALLSVARELVYRDKAPCDPAFAEKMFAAAEAAGGAEAFDDELLFMRASNLEAADELGGALEGYRKLLAKFSSSSHAEAALFRAAVLSEFVARDAKAARGYYEQLASHQPADACTLAALYQMGLLKQWEQDPAAAKELYAKALQAAGDGYPETKALIQARMQEIENSKPIDFALKTFLDNSLGETGATFDMSKAQIKSPLVQPASGEELTLTSSAMPGESGCTQVVLSHYWAGNLGSANPGGDQPSFSTTYKEPGPKAIFLTVMSPTGVVDRAIKLIDVK